MKKIILLQPYAMLSKGDEMTVTAGVAEQLIRRGIAREAEEKTAKEKRK